MKIVKKIHNIGVGNVTSIKLSPDGGYLACSSSDGNVYFFNTANDYAPVGLAAAMNATTEVADFDWSVDSDFMRCFGPAGTNDSQIAMSFFAIEKSASEAPATPLKEDVDIDPIVKGTVKWATASSPAAFEAAGCHRALEPGMGAELREMPGKQAFAGVHSLSTRFGSLVAGYTDGSVRLYNFPARPTECVTLDTPFTVAPARAVFLTGGSVACISDETGCIAVYK
jgi:WD40 repeat protein